MNQIDKLKLLNEIDTLEQERKIYGPREEGVRYFFMQDLDDPDMYRIGEKKFTIEEIRKYAKYDKVFVMRPTSQMSTNRDKS